MTQLQRLGVNDSTAARMIGVTKAEFLAMVRTGTMPQPRPLGPGILRWRVADLDDALRPPRFEAEEFEP
ncbi:helix-turn-helix transcriptional regulator [Mangrovicoccus algicola]|uniref:AlpA family transcriptional regulator n=1 Tax=Mangrovicoccus algicola TaxID=2771008 RepID=A0A8J6YWE9_9RHOB|nr:hypothetical protein [Mangrovicoccus algicola]MBE3637489.1 hypothetical protein [Mangrovicoccus algicola]